MKIRITVLLVLTATIALAQEEPPPTGSTASQNPVTLATEFFENNNFLNYFAFANAVYDTYNPTLDSNGKSVNHGGVGFQVGGGASARHVWQKSVLTFSYSGSYRDYSSSFFGSGTDQNLGINYSRRLARHLSMNVAVGAGTVLFGTGYVAQEQVGTGNIQLNPYSNSTRFFSGSVGLSYQQSRRLGYSLSGGFYMQRYSYPSAVGSTGGSGNIGVNYRVTARTTIFANYSRSYFVFQRGAGTSTVDSYSGSVSRRFANHWTASGSVGVSRSHVTGTAVVPVTLSTVAGATLTGYVSGPYNSVSVVPSFSGSVTHFLKRSSFSASGGQNIVSGNGFYLASKNQFLSGVYSRSFRRSNASFGGNWNRLNSVANSIAYGYTTTGLTANYGHSLAHHIGINARYDFIRYGAFAGNKGVDDSRFSFGFTLSSQSIPITLY